MAELELKITLPRTRVLVGEPLKIETSLLNNGSRVALVHSPDTESPFDFSLTSAGGIESLFSLALHTEAQVEAPRPAEPELIPLAPGSVATFEDDVVNYATTPLAVGTYTLVVRYRSLDEDEVESSPLQVTVLGLSAVGIATVGAFMDRTLPTTLAHLSETGRIFVCQREGHVDSPIPDAVPDPGTLLRRVELAPGATACGVATAVRAAPTGPAGRWAGWIQPTTAAPIPSPSDADEESVAQDNSNTQWALGALFGSGTQLLTTQAPTELSLDDARLLTTGWQYPDGRAVFLVLGQKDDAQLSVVTVTAQNGVQPKQLSLETPSVPKHFVANSNAAGQLQLVWAEVSDDRTTLYQRAVPADPSVSAPAATVLLGSDTPLRALSVSPVDERDREFIDALFGPNESGSLTYRRLGLGDGQSVAEWSVAPPHDAEGEPLAVQTWTISSRPVEGAPLLAGVGDRVYAQWAARGSDWVLLGDGVSDLDSLRLSSLPRGTVWASWADPAVGIRYVRVPPAQ